MKRALTHHRALARLTPMDQQHGPDFTAAVASNSGWLLALLFAAWGWLLRLALGRHLKRTDEERESTAKWMSSVDTRLGRIEGRLDERRRAGDFR